MHNYNDFLSQMGDIIVRKTLKPKRLYFEVEDKNILEVADHLFNKMGCRLSTATAQESYRGIEVLYHFSHDKTGEYYCPRVVMSDKQHPKMSSITPIFIGAEWIEREMAEMFGIVFEGHPKPERLLTGNHPRNLSQPMKHRRNDE
jgi:NADH:ubiquinone oxidoreductase subunit C